MKPLPNRPDLDHLKRQAKDLLAAYRRGTSDALARFRENLPAARGRDDAAILAMGLRLHDAQSCIAREYGFVSWPDLKTYVEVTRARESNPEALADAFCRLVYSGDIAGGMSRASPGAAARLLAEHPELTQRDPWIACAAGDAEKVRRRIAADSSWVNRVGGPAGITPLIATSHSSMLGAPDIRDGLLATADLLLEAGADPNLTVAKHWSAGNGQPEEWQVSALHGAAGVNHDPELTRRLLAAGADPNDGESLYHSLDKPLCTPLLLEAGATVGGTNALFRCLDFDDIDTFRLLLAHADGADDLKGGRLLFWAIRRRRSLDHVKALLAAGVDPTASNRDGVGAYIQALRYGLPEVAEALKAAGAAADLEDEDRFLAACAGGDATEARRIQRLRPDLPSALDEDRLRMLPELAEAGHAEAVRLMANLGWPLDVRGGDWKASALNQAVFRGDAALVRHLLKRGASWLEEHGFGDNACGTLSWASINRPPGIGNWHGCAEALVAHGMPMAERLPEDPESVLVAGVRRKFSDEVTSFLLGEDREPAT